jgi:hypothetical protein
MRRFGSCFSQRVSAEIDRLRDKGTDEDRHKEGTEGQRARAEGLLCFVPLNLCHFAPFFCAWVMAQKEN